METILRPPQWPKELSHFVTWCLMWDPRSRPTSLEAMQHPYFVDAADPLRPKSSTSRILGKKHASIDGKAQRESTDGPATTSKPSWFRKSLVRDNPVTLPLPEQSTETAPVQRPPSPRPEPTKSRTEAYDTTHSSRFRPFASKRSTWTNGANAAPMPILPTIRPISPFRANVNAEAHNNAPKPQAHEPNAPANDVKPNKKIGRQLSVQSQNNHYADREAEQLLNGQRIPQSPSENRGFFAHLRKKARRFSGKPQGNIVISGEAGEGNKGAEPYQSQRSSMVVDSNIDAIVEKNSSEVDKALHAATYGATPLSPSPDALPAQHQLPSASTTNLTPQRHPSLSKCASTSALDAAPSVHASLAPISSRTRRALQKSTQPNSIYDTPDEEDELLHEALTSAQDMRKNMERRSRIEDEYYQKSLSRINTNTQSIQISPSNSATLNPYPTPSPSAKRNGMLFDQSIMDQPVSAIKLNEPRNKPAINHRWPTPPYEENEWAASAAASIFAASSAYQ